MHVLKSYDRRATVPQLQKQHNRNQRAWPGHKTPNPKLPTPYPLQLVKKTPNTHRAGNFMARPLSILTMTRRGQGVGFLLRPSDEQTDTNQNGKEATGTPANTDQLNKMVKPVDESGTVFQNVSPTCSTMGDHPAVAA
jgi:hypothetical protein